MHDEVMPQNNNQQHCQWIWPSTCPLTVGVFYFCVKLFPFFSFHLFSHPPTPTTHPPFFSFILLTSIGITVRPSVSSCPCVWFCPDRISWTTQSLITKLGMVMYYYEAECLAKKMFHYSHCQGHSEGFYYNQNMTISTISSKLMTCLQPDLVC